MPKLPQHGDQPDKKEPGSTSEQREDLWSPEFSEQQRAVVSSMIDIVTAPRPDNEQERVDDMGRMLKDSLAHMKFKGLDIPTGVSVDKQLTGAIGWALAMADEMTLESLQPLMEQKLKEMGVEVEEVDQLGLIAYVYKVASWRGSDGFDRTPYSETATARETVDKIVVTVADQEGVISADDIIAELSTTNIRVGAEKVKKGKGKKPDKITSAWQNTSANTRELIAMILTEVAGKLEGSLEIDENGKPYVSVDADGKPVERHDLVEEESPEGFQENLSMFINEGFNPFLEDQTEQSLRETPIEIGGLVQALNIDFETIENLSKPMQETFKAAILAAAKQIFPNAILKETDEGLFLTVE